jgi:hypothetical protein
MKFSPSSCFFLPPASSSLLVPYAFLSTLFYTENLKFHETNKITKKRAEHHGRLNRMYQFNCNRVLRENCASDEKLSRDIIASMSIKEPRIDISRRAFPDIFVKSPTKENLRNPRQQESIHRTVPFHKAV